MTIVQLIKKVFTVKGLVILVLLQISLTLLCSMPRLPDNSKITTASWPEYKHLISRFEAEDRKLIDEAIARLNGYFDKMERNIDPFLDDIYGITSKGKMLWYMLQGTDEEFIEGKFNTYFGSSNQVRGILNRITNDISQELNYNNERLAVELGELLPSTLKSKEKIAGQVEDAGHFADRARNLANTIVIRTSCVQIGIEVASLAVDCYFAEQIAACIIASLTAEGLLVVEGVGGSLATFGVSAVIAIAIDIVANKISRATLRPKIKMAIQERRRETIAAFRKSITKMVERFEYSRKRTIDNTLNVGFLFKLKSFFAL